MNHPLIPSVRWLVVAAAMIAVAGCGAIAPRPAAEFYAAGAPLARCADFLHHIDAVVAESGVGDGMAARVPGFPHLRATRFLASYAGETLDSAQAGEWVRRLAQLGRDAYEAEIANLPAAARAGIEGERAQRFTGKGDAAAAAASCGQELASADLASRARLEELRAAVRVPDDYLTWQRIAGLYWLTRIPFAAGIRIWQDGTRETFEQPLFMLPVYGERWRFVPPPASPVDVSAVLERASANPLGIPEPRGADREALFRAFAPEFMVDVVSDADRPGAPGWHGEAVPTIDIMQPVVYRRMSHTRYRGRALLQVSYAIWFPERPLAGEWDLLGGHLDSVVWRVTLTPEGEPWVYDSMHHCGCYHEFFPTARAELRPQPDTLDETAFVPQWLPVVGSGERLSLRLQAGTHYLQRVVVGAAGSASGTARYVFAEDDELRSLPAAGVGRRSLFRPDGIVPGTARGERFWFWPMGVPDPGAMRQWGRHATAFVGRRHFDDADLFEKYFEMRAP